MNFNEDQDHDEDQEQEQEQHQYQLQNDYESSLNKNQWYISNPNAMKLCKYILKHQSMKKYINNIESINKVMESSMLLLTQLEMYHKYHKQSYSKVKTANNNNNNESIHKILNDSSSETNLLNITESNQNHVFDIDNDTIKIEPSSQSQSQNEHYTFDNDNDYEQLSDTKNNKTKKQKLPQYGFIKNNDKSSLTIVATKDTMKNKEGSLLFIFCFHSLPKCIALD